MRFLDGHEVIGLVALRHVSRPSQDAQDANVTTEEADLDSEGYLRPAVRVERSGEMHSRRGDRDRKTRMFIDDGDVYRRFSSRDAAFSAMSLTSMCNLSRMAIASSATK